MQMISTIVLMSILFILLRLYNINLFSVLKKNGKDIVSIFVFFFGTWILILICDKYIGNTISRLTLKFSEIPVPIRLPIIAIIAMMVPTGRYGAYPLVYYLYTKGMDIGSITTFLSADAMGEITSVYIEFYLFGLTFIIIHFLTSLFVSIVEGLILGVIEHSMSLYHFQMSDPMDITLFIDLFLAVCIKFVLNEINFELKLDRSIKSYFLLSAVGIMTPGPLFVVIPILSGIKGMTYSQVFAYITGQTLSGPVRIGIEASMFGYFYVFLRILLAWFLGGVTGIILRFMEDHNLIPLYPGSSGK